MGKLILRVLGAPQIIEDGRNVAFPTRKSLALLLYLAVEGGTHSREKITALLWPDRDSSGSRAALRTTLTRLRAALEHWDDAADPPYIRAEGDTLSFNFDSDFEFDFQVLQAAVKTIREIDADTTSLLSVLQAAVDSYQGDFLDGFEIQAAPEFESWIELQRHACQTRLGSIYERLCALRSDTGDSTGAVLAASQWISQQPAAEKAYYWLMKAHFASGDRAAALQAYETCRAVLTEMLSVEPAPETVALAEQIRVAAPLRLAYSAKAHDGESVVWKHPGDLRAPMVGREHEYAALVLAYQRARHGGLQIVTVEGEAGIGKTRLAAEFINWAAVQGADEIEGRAFEVGGRLPYQALVEGLRPRLERENAPDDLLSDVWLTELSRLLPELRERYPDLSPPLSSGDDEARLRLFESVAQLGLAFSKRAPLVICVNDLQWLDTASLDLLHYGVQRWREGFNPLLIILTVRLEALRTNPMLVNWLVSLGRDAKLTRVTLQGLTAAATEQFIASLAMEPNDAHVNFSGWLFQETAGQPFYMIESVKALLERDLLRASLRTDGSWALDFSAVQQSAADLHGFVPSTVRDLIQSRLTRLSASGSALLAAASVLGHDFVFEDLCQVADLRTSDGLSALDEVLIHGLLRQSDETAYNFAHDKIRDVAYTEAGAPRRRLLHRRALQAVEARATAAELAHHALGAAMSKPAFQFSLKAGDEAVRLFALQEGIDHYERAIQVWQAQDQRSTPEPISSMEIAQVYSQLGRALELSNFLDKAEAVYHQMAQVVDQPALVALGLQRLAMIALQAHNDLEAAQVLLQQAIPPAEASQNKAILAETEWNIAQICYYGAETEASMKHGERALALARELDLPELTARSLNVTGYAHLNLNESLEAERNAGEAYALFSRLGNRSMEADCLSLQVEARVRLGRTEPGIDALRSALSISEQLGDSWGRANGANKLALALLESGDYEEALHYGRQCRETAQIMNNPGWHILTLCGIGAVFRALFDLEATRRTFVEAQSISQTMPSGAYFAGLLATHSAIASSMAHAWDEASTCALQAQSFQNFDLLHIGLARWYEIEALLRGSYGKEAEERLALYERRSRFNPRYRVWYLCALAVYHRHRNLRDEIIPCLYEASELCEQLVLPGEQFEVQLTLSAVYVWRGEVTLARSASARAGEIASELAQRISDSTLRSAFEAAAVKRLSDMIED